MDGVKERQDLVNKIKKIVEEGKLNSLDDDTKEIVTNALFRMSNELEHEAANIARNISFLNDYREARAAKRP